MANHLIIGLGGTGGKVICALRKRIYEEFRSLDPGQGVFIDYVYVDSSTEDLNNRSDWKVLGKSVALGESQKVNINGISTSMLSNITMYPGMEAFLTSDDLHMMQTKMGTLINDGIGGQRRRLGRTLIANNLADNSDPRNFKTVVHGAVNRLQRESGDQEVTFHICAGLAGGTGSGSIVDVISQIRTWYPYQDDTKSFKIRLLLYVPERVVAKPKHDAGFYQANGYAALQELNALSTRKYHPVDVTGEKDIYTQKVQRLLASQNAFEAAYIYSNVNERGKILDLGQDLPRAVGDFLFQSIVASALSGAGGQLVRLVNCENNGSEPEMDQAGHPDRSRKFLSFGITRIEYPESEVSEFVTYTFARQAAAQLTYNYWTGVQGFGEKSIEEVGSGFLDEIKNKRNRESLLLSNAYLTLSSPIIASDSTKRWKDLDMTWQNRTEADADDVQTTIEKKSWLGEFDHRCKVFYEEQFRNHGVKNFYSIQRKELKAYARFIRRHIEKKLFDEWAAGAENGKSVLEIEKYTQLLIQDCSDRIQAFAQQKAKLLDEMEGCKVDISKAKVDWDNIGWLKDTITNASTRVFSSFKTAQCSYYSLSTRVEAYDYAKELLQEIILELTNMLEGVRAFKDQLLAISEEVKEKAATKCKVHEEAEDTNIKKYDPAKVHAIAGQYVANRERQTAAAAAIRTRLIANLGEEGEHTFANLYDKADYEQTIDVTLDICGTHARQAMEDTAKSDPLSQMVGVNILDKLKQELNSDEKLEAFVKEVVATSSAYVQFNPAEKSKVFAGNTGAVMNMVQLCLPAPSEKTQKFRQDLIDAFVRTIPGFDASQDVSVHYKANQIVVVSAYAGFPLRYLTNLTVLKEKYDRLVNAPDGAFNRMVLHTESFREELPSLFELDSAELKKQLFKPLMLAYAMNILAEQQDPTTGQRFTCMKSVDEFGCDTWTPLGSNFATIWDALSNDYAKAMQLMAQVQAELAVQARSNDQKVALKKALGGVLQGQVKTTLCENNEFHPDFARYKALAVEILNNELKEL